MIESRNRRPPAIVGLALALALLFPSAVTASRGDDLRDRIDEIVGAEAGLDLFSGTVVVARHGEIVYAEAVGEANKEHGVSNTLETRFNISSVQKTLIATVIMQLVQSGQISLSDSLIKYFPDCPYPTADQIQISHLLNHSSGLADYRDNEEYQAHAEELQSIDEVLPFLYALEPAFAPGESFEYSNAGVLYLKAIIERVTGQRLNGALAQRIFRPLGMDGTAFHSDGQVTPPRATGYRLGPDGETYLRDGGEPSAYTGGGIYTTGLDLLKFDQALYGEELLDEHHKTVMFTPERSEPSAAAATWRKGVAHEQLGELDQAKECYRRSLELAPAFSLASEALERLGGAASIAGDEPVDFAQLSGEFLGQTPPGASPEMFAPGIISTEHHDTIYPFMSGGTLLVFDRWSAGEPEPDPLDFPTFATELKDGAWTEPLRASVFSKPSDESVSLVPDGSTFYFGSLRSRDGRGRSTTGRNLWLARRTPAGFSNPRMLGPPVNSEKNDIFPSITRDGSLYFFSERGGGFGKADIYRAPLVDGKHGAVENLGAVINTANDEIDPFIAWDETYLIFCSKTLDGLGGYDLYISFRGPDGSWTAPLNMGEGINAAAEDWIPSVTADGRYFFFGSDRAGTWDVYWVNAQVIEGLRPSDWSEGPG